MARIAGVDIPNEKRIVTSLTYIYGIGDTRAQHICDKFDIDPHTKTSALTEDQARTLYEQAAVTLTACYDIQSSEQVSAVCTW